MPDDATLTPEEAAAYLKVNPQTIYRNLRRGRLPGAKVGRQWRIRRRDLERFLTGASIVAEEVLPWPMDHKATVAKVTRDRQTLLQAELERFIRVVGELMKPFLRSHRERSPCPRSLLSPHPLPGRPARLPR